MRQFFSFLKKISKTKKPEEVRKITRSQHGISRKNLSSNALKVLYRLHNADFQAYLVGGCVRDMLLGREPKDFDIATDATPEQVNDLFKNGRLIGKRFKIVHVLFRQEIIEVSTFRAEQSNAQKTRTSKEGMLLRDNVFGDIHDDADRRDFTVNALYYSIADFSVMDFHQGIKDLEKGLLRMIGDPNIRYREDPVRMLRAVRLAAKLGFRIEANTEAPIFELKDLLAHIAPARLFTEVLKLFLGGQALETFKQLRHYQLFEFLFPDMEKILNTQSFARVDNFVTLLFKDTDNRIAEQKTVSPGYLTAALLWYPFLIEYRKHKKILKEHSAAFSIAFTNIHANQQKAASIPKHFMMAARNIWELQFRMEKFRANRCFAIVNHQRFRAGFDFLQLRNRAGEPLQKYVDWWQQFYNASEDDRVVLLKDMRTSPFRQSPKKQQKYG